MRADRRPVPLAQLARLLQQEGRQMPLAHVVHHGPGGHGAEVGLGAVAEGLGQQDRAGAHVDAVRERVAVVLHQAQQLEHADFVAADDLGQILAEIAGKMDHGVRAHAAERGVEGRASRRREHLVTLDRLGADVSHHLVEEIATVGRGVVHVDVKRQHGLGGESIQIALLQGIIALPEENHPLLSPDLEVQVEVEHRRGDQVGHRHRQVRLQLACGGLSESLDGHGHAHVATRATKGDRSPPPLGALFASLRSKKQ